MATFSNALSGLNANAKAIDITSSNLSNLNTFGYKTNQVSFQDLVHQSLGALYNGSQDILGTVTSQSSKQFLQGALQTTGGPFDAAIQGNGFFTLQNATGQQVLTRDGQFKVNANGQLVTADGNFVQGWNAVGGVLSTSGPSGNLSIPNNPVRAAQASTFFSITANLNGNGVTGQSTGSFIVPISVNDSLGNAHQLSVDFEKTGAGAWSYTVSMPSADVTGGTGTLTQLATGNLTFDSNGNLLPAGLPANGQIAITASNLADGANSLSLNWNLNDASSQPLITQFGQPSSASSTNKDGWTSSRLVNVSIGDQGKLLASYTDGSTVAVGQLAMASVLNPDSLQEISGNEYAATPRTSPPVIGVPGTGSLGSVTGGALEASTVDIAQEFTHLLTYQRGYQANSKVITTEDEIIQSTLALKQ